MALIPYERVPGDKDPPLTVEGRRVVELYCGDPACDCLTGHLVQEDTPVAIDVGTGRLDFLDLQTQVLKEPLREALARKLREEGVLERLRAHYLAVRRYGEDHHWEYVDWTTLRSGELVRWAALFPKEGVPMLPVFQEPKVFQEDKPPQFDEEEVLFRLGLEDAYAVDARTGGQGVLWTVFAAARGERSAARRLGTVVYDFKKGLPAVHSAAPGVDQDQLLFMVITLLQQYPGILEDHRERAQRILKLLLPLIQKQRRAAETTRAAQQRAVGRNEPCPCGSGKKYKRCHGSGDKNDKIE